jgi:LytR cell envelope-related transcriptional attenuator
VTTQSAYAVKHPVAWDLALRATSEQPGIHQGELAERLHRSTGLAPTTAIRLLRSMEREGALAGVRDGRRKAYRPASSNGASPNGRPAVAAGRGSAWRKGSRRGLAALVLAILTASALVAIVAAPTKRPAERERTAVAPAIATPDSPAAATTERRSGTPRRARGAAPDPSKIDVAALSGVGVAGIAARTGQRLKAMGFKLGVVANAAGPLPVSVVFYDRGAARKARAVARRLGISQRRPVDPVNHAIADGASVVVVLGGDRTH